MSVTGPQTMDASYCRPAAASRDRRTDNRGQIEGGLLWQSAVTSVLRRLELAGVEGVPRSKRINGLTKVRQRSGPKSNQTVNPVLVALVSIRKGLVSPRIGDIGFHHPPY
jgi:hypothetical protein